MEELRNEKRNLTRTCILSLATLDCQTMKEEDFKTKGPEHPISIFYLYWRANRDPEHPCTSVSRLFCTDVQILQFLASQAIFVFLQLQTKN